MDNVIFIVIAAGVALVLPYLKYINSKCYSCGEKLKSKKYLAFDDKYETLVHVCQECFFDGIK